MLRGRKGACPLRLRFFRLAAHRCMAGDRPSAFPPSTGTNVQAATGITRACAKRCVGPSFAAVFMQKNDVFGQEGLYFAACCDTIASCQPDVCRRQRVMPPPRATCRPVRARVPGYTARRFGGSGRARAQKHPATPRHTLPADTAACGQGPCRPRRRKTARRGSADARRTLRPPPPAAQSKRGAGIHAASAART
jgi:hypothetical protein